MGYEDDDPECGAPPVAERVSSQAANAVKYAGKLLPRETIWGAAKAALTSWLADAAKG